ncbi:MAG: PAS domain S-box protein [Methanoregula sp.]|nr:PAS domain S-box protein [Methanoregula sp.]
MNKNPQGMTITQIAQKTRINRNTVGRYLENLLVSGQVEMRRFGMKKIYALSQRVALSSILSISSELVVQMDSSLRIIYANEPFLTLVGSDNNSLIGKNIEYTPVSMVFDELFEGFIENIKEGVLGKEWSGEFVLGTKDIHLFCRIIPTVFDDGRKGVSVILEDITERKVSEAALFASEKRFQSLVEMLPQSIWECDDQGNVTYVNQRTYEMYGYDYEDVKKGMTLWQTIHPDDRERVLGDFIRASGEEPSEFPAFHEFMSIRKDGSTFPLITYHVPIVHENKITGMRGIGIDISERKRAEEALRESEEKYRTLVNRANDAICVIQDGVIKMYNPRFSEFWGGSEEEIMGRPYTDFVHPDALPDIIKKYNRRMSGESFPSTYETTMMRKDGSRSFVEMNAGIIEYEGRPADLVIVRDINDRKMAQDALRRSEELYRTLSEASNDLIFVIDRNDHVEYVNSYAAAMVNKPIKEIIGSPRQTLFPPEVAIPQKKALDTVFEQGISVRSSSPLTFKGRTYWYDHILSPLKDPDNNIRSVLGISRDITERKIAEAAIVQGEQQLRNLINAIGDIAWETDAESRFVYVSPQVETILGYTTDELIGQTPFNFLHPDAVPVNKNTFQAAVESRQRSVLHVSHWIHKDGHDVLLESNAIPKYDRNGSFSGFIGIDRKR